VGGGGGAGGVGGGGGGGGGEGGRGVPLHLPGVLGGVAGGAVCFLGVSLRDFCA